MYSKVQYEASGRPCGVDDASFLACMHFPSFLPIPKQLFARFTGSLVGSFLNNPEIQALEQLFPQGLQNLNISPSISFSPFIWPPQSVKRKELVRLANVV